MYDQPVTYTVEQDGKPGTVLAKSLAEACDYLRDSAKRIKVWSPAGILLIDTLYGDAYGIARRT
jgi:hypothetical protein